MGLALLALIVVIGFVVYATKKGWIGGDAAAEVTKVEGEVEADATKVESDVTSDASAVVKDVATKL